MSQEEIQKMVAVMAENERKMKEYVAQINQENTNKWNMAAAASQASNLQSLLLNDLVSGIGTHPPKLLEMSDYNSWKDRIQTHMEGMEGGIWEALGQIYVRPINKSTGMAMAYDQMNEQQRERFMLKRRLLQHSRKPYLLIFCISSPK